MKLQKDAPLNYNYLNLRFLETVDSQNCYPPQARKDTYVKFQHNVCNNFLRDNFLDFSKLRLYVEEIVYGAGPSWRKESRN